MKSQSAFKVILALFLFATFWPAGSALSETQDSGTRIAPAQPFQPTAARSESAPRPRPGTVLGAEDPPPAVWEADREMTPASDENSAPEYNYSSSGE